MIRFLVVAILSLWVGEAWAQSVPLSYFGEQPSKFTTVAWPTFPMGTVRLWDACDSNSNAGVCGTYNGTFYVKWEDIETSNGGAGCTTGYVWTYIDNIVNKAIAEGAAPLYTFGYIPGWANGNAGASVPPTDLTSAGSPSFSNFASCLAARYKGKIKYYGLWNEPTVSGTWTGTTQQMVYMSVGAYAAIKAADPNAIVLSPEYIPIIWQNLAGANYQVWMDEFLADGGGPYFDAVAMHPYPADSVPPVRPPEYLANVAAYNNYALAAYGVSSKAVWATEWSFASSLGTGLGPLPYYLAVYYILGYPLGVSGMLHYQFDNSDSAFILQGGNQGLNAGGAALRTVASWLLNGTWTSAPARQQNANGIRNQTMSGAVAGTGSTCATMTNGTAPTHMSVSNPDSGHGINWQVVDVGANYIDLRVCGTETAGGTGALQLALEAGQQIAASPSSWWTLNANVSLDAGSLTNVSPNISWNETSSGGGYLATDGFRFVYPLAQSLLDVSAQAYWSYTTQLTNASVAFVQPFLSFGYTVGNAFDITLRIASPEMDSGTIWSGNITRGNGATSQIVWDASGGPTNFSTSYSYYRDLNGGGSHAISGGAVTLTNSPIILDTAAQAVRMNFLLDRDIDRGANDNARAAWVNKAA